MNNKIITLSMLVATLFATTSCLQDNSQTDIVTYDDTAITSFTLGTLEQVRDTIDNNGNDSTYIATFSGDKYKFYIDHTNAKIYNADSLPYGTKTNAVLASIGTKNGGEIAIKSLTDETFEPYSSTDSIDFSQDRQLYVYAYSLKAYRIYTVTVNVKKQKTNNVKWSSLADNADFATFTSVKAVSAGDKVFVAGESGTTTTLYSTTLDDGNAWTVSSKTFSVSAYKNLVAQGNTLFILDNNKVLSSTDGNEWTEMGEDNTLQSLFASPLNLYAITIDGKIKVSTDEGKTWTEETLSDSAEKLPVSHISCALLATNSGPNLSRMLLVGCDAKNNVVEWTRLINTEDTSVSYNWATVESSSPYSLPAYNALSVLNYKNRPLALGLTPENKIANLLLSGDQGLTWMSNKDYPAPSTSATASTLTATVDKDNYLWLISGNKVWKGFFQ